MKIKEIIPIKKELSFVVKLVSFMVISVIITLLILYLFLSKNVGASFRAAFQSMSEAYGTSLAWHQILHFRLPFYEPHDFVGFRRFC